MVQHLVNVAWEGNRAPQYMSWPLLYCRQGSAHTGQQWSKETST